MCEESKILKGMQTSQIFGQSWRRYLNLLTSPKGWPEQREEIQSEDETAKQPRRELQQKEKRKEKKKNISKSIIQITKKCTDCVF
jgi:hypothetical protein